MLDPLSREAQLDRAHTAALDRANALSMLSHNGAWPEAQLDAQIQTAMALSRAALDIVTILRSSRLLSDPDLIEIVKHRSQEHLLVIALRAPLSAEVAEAIVDHGDDRVLEQLLKNPDAILSRRALEYLVGESQRVDSFQEPLLSRHDLPGDLAHRMFWWVSAALRKEIGARWFVVSDYRMYSMLRWHLRDAVPVVQINERARYIGLRNPALDGPVGLYVAPKDNPRAWVWDGAAARLQVVGQADLAWRGIVYDVYAFQKVTGWGPLLSPAPGHPLYAARPN